MKLPGNIDGDEPAGLLARYGYRKVRQTGSHQRLSGCFAGKIHEITIPRHKPLRVGTLHRILSDIAIHHHIPLQELIDELFG